MTERLYEADPYCRECRAVVVSCEPAGQEYEVVLERTCFYPEGGGQPGDQGFLELMDSQISQGKRIAVVDTTERNGEIVHRTREAVEPGTEVTGRIDWERRFDLMQNHTGEHIVSGLIHARFGYNNVGFHMGSDLLTIDLDGEFSQEQMRELEREANLAVWKNLPVDVRVYSHEEVGKLEYRSKKEIPGPVRIVTIPDTDVCACCGTHVARTGEIGLIKLISLQKFRRGVRMEMICGTRALALVNQIWDQNHLVSVALSAKPGETGAAARKLKEAQAAQNYRLMELENQMFARRARELAGTGDALLFEDGLTPDGVRRLAVAVMESCGGRCAVFSGDDEQGYKYAMGEKDGDLRELVKEMNRLLGGRGGGKPFFVQGSLAASRARIEAFFLEK